MNNEEIRDEPQSQEQNNEKKKRNRIIEIIIVIILLLLLLTRCCSSCSNLSPTDTSDISQGEIEWNQPRASRDLQAEIDKAVEQGMFNVFMNTNIVSKTATLKVI